MTTVILLLFPPVSPMHKNAQRTIDWFEDFLVEYPIRVISVAIV